MIERYEEGSGVSSLSAMSFVKRHEHRCRCRPGIGIALSRHQDLGMPDNVCCRSTMTFTEREGSRRTRRASVLGYDISSFDRRLLCSNGG